MFDYLWLFAVVAGPLILGGAPVSALLRQRRLTAREERAQTQATREFFDKDSRKR